MKESEKPVLLMPIYFEHIWGGELLKQQLGKNHKSNTVGESWELSVHPHGHSHIASGVYSGMSFEKYYADILGNKQKCSILIKFIGAKQNLSVQVHPGKNTSDEGSKKEAWYIISPPKDGTIIAGINCSREEFERASKLDNVEDCLEYIPCKEGDVLEIKPGLVHALTYDAIVYEVQQNSDVTYRLYDWGRVDSKTGKPREMHVEKALEVIDYTLEANILQSETIEKQIFIKNDCFSLEKLCVTKHYKEKSSCSCAYTVINGFVEVFYDNESVFTAKKGQTLYAPNGNVTFVGTGTLLKGIEAKDYR